MRQVIDRDEKGIPSTVGSSIGWTLFDDCVTLPVALLLQAEVVHNSAVMASYCMRHSVSLAPHGKTTMSPELFNLQIRDGAWAITAATVYQARVMRESGVPRVLIANEVAAPGDINWLGSQIDDGFDVICCVDSIESVKLLDEVLGARSTKNPLRVLVELGVLGGRTGARTVDSALVVARAAAATATLQVIGVTGFEGIIGPTSTKTAEERVDLFLEDLSDLARRVYAENLVRGAEEMVVSAGGSVFFDRVVVGLKGIRDSFPARIVIRSGCYLSHDDGVIHELSPLGAEPRIPGEVFRSAIEVWAAVLSRPEPTRVIVGAGKRDMSTDGLLPVAKKVLRRGSRTVEHISHPLRAVRVDDQHAYLDIAESFQLSVGDFVAFGISHPCTTFDKWRVMPVVDENYKVVDIITTRF